jgi:hypothetical protein
MSNSPRIAADCDESVLECSDALCQASSRQGSSGPTETRLPIATAVNEEAVVTTADESCAGYGVPRDSRHGRPLRWIKAVRCLPASVPTSEDLSRRTPS